MLNFNQLHPELVGCATNLLSFMCNDSASRLAMVGNHLTQMLVTEGATTRRTKSGMEREYAKYTFDIKMPATGKIVRIIARYGKSSVVGASRPPEIVIIYEDLDAKVEGRSVMGSVSIRSYHSKHQNYGFKYVIPQHIISHLQTGQIINKGAILARSPNVTPNGDYAFGIETNVAYMSIPQIIEDGFVVSESYCERMATTALGNRMVSWGKNHIPLNLYGDENTYRPFPEIGMKVRPDGLIFATRELEDYLGVIDLAPIKLRKPSVVFDNCFYAPPGAEIIDINILHDLTLSQLSTPVGMEEQIQRYAAAQSGFYSAVATMWEEFYREHRKHGEVQASDELHRLLAQDCYPDNPNATDHAVPRTYRATPLAEWTLDLKFARRVVPTVGFKITDLHGGKGVICAVRKDEDMPLDMWGNRADVIMDGDSTIKRMNFGRLYEHWVGATCRQIEQLVRNEITLERLQNDLQYLPEHLRQTYADLATGLTDDKCVKILKDFYCTVSPIMAEKVLNSLKTQKDWLDHLEYVRNHPIEVIIPTNSPNVGGMVIWQLANQFPIPIGPVTYVGASGIRRVTKEPILIGSKYVILLEKTGEDWAAVASAKRQHYGVLARLTNRDKYSSPWRRQPVRILGEAEVRLLCAVIPPKMVAELLELPNSPKAQRHIAKMLLTAKAPTAIKRIISQDEMPRGQSRSLLFVRHFMECAGCRYTNK